MRTHWRDCKEWIDCGIPLSSPSNEACKLYDASLSQLCGFYNEPSVGGFDNSIKAMLEADPDMIMGHVLRNSLSAGGSARKISTDTKLRKNIENMEILAKKNGATDREMRHVNAVKLLAEGERYEACKIWKRILQDYPTDTHAAREWFFTMFGLGKQVEGRDTLASVLPYYDTTIPHYGNVLGWHAFLLQETRFYKESEKNARKCLEMESRDCWASHTLSHVYLEQGLTDAGLNFMRNTEGNWSSCSMLASHNYWHYALFQIDKNNFEEALGIYDKEVTNIATRALKSRAEFAFCDASSLLYRLKLEGVNVKNRWKDIADVCQKFRGNHVRIFTDAHVVLTLTNAELKSEAQEMLDTLQEFVRTGKGDNFVISKEMGLTLCQGVLAFEQGDYGKATDLLNPIKYDVINIGGSHAQRDVFIQLLIHAALKSPKAQHNKLGRMLLYERESQRQQDPLTERLLADVVKTHVS